MWPSRTIYARTGWSLVWLYEKCTGERNDPDYPSDCVKVFCDERYPGELGDGVCGGGMNVNAGHMVYLRNDDGKKAIGFLKSKIDALFGASRARQQV
jgi:hypothetical protein